MTEERIRNPLRERSLAEIIDVRYSRRDMLGTVGKLGLAAAFAGLVKPVAAFAQEAAPMLTPQASASSLTFREIAKNSSATHTIATGYDAHLLIRWGDRLSAESPAFDPQKQSAEAQLQQFGYNNDFLAFMPFPQGSDNSNHGLLCANSEYTCTYLMFPGLAYDDAAYHTTKEQVDVEMAAHGHNIVEVRRADTKWEPVIGSPYNRRISPYATDIALKGPAAGHPRMRTAEDPDGRTVRGTFGNCAGGKTPWGTVLVSEENFDGYFMGTPKNDKEGRNHTRYGIGEELWCGWGRFYDRFDIAKEPHEPNRFGWVVEYDPYDPQSQPVKHTWLGRFKHESATVTLAPDGRVVVYSGDDQKFEYIYRFVSAGKYNAKDRKANFNLLDDGMLHVAKFHEDGTLEWLPLTFGQNGLTPENGFADQGEVLIETRRAADVLGATPMDRPEGIAVHPRTHQVFVSLTNNNRRETPNTANTRANNIHGHIIEFLPPEGDHAANRFAWRIFLQGGNPADKETHAFYPAPPSEHGWLSCPDNLAIDPEGRLWICTDGQSKTLKLNDGLYACDTSGTAAGQTRLFFSGPRGCEITGACFTPDGRTLFLSVQHPGDSKTATYDAPESRWPDFQDGMPPRPSVLAITKDDNGIIGS